MNKKTVWVVVALVGGYIFCQMLADIGATKLVAIGKYVIPGGTFVFAITFTLRDMIHKRLGREWARAAIVIAGIVNILMSAYLRWIAGMAGVQGDEYVQSWSGVFAIVPAIVIGSITAEIVSELIDTEVYHVIRDRFRGPWQFVRVIISNAISLPVDSIIFASMAFVFLPPVFGESGMPFVEIWPIVWGQVIFKAIVTAVSLPGIYLVKEKTIIS